jgi:hypothetical protein
MECAWTVGVNGPALALASAAQGHATITLLNSVLI